MNKNLLTSENFFASPLLPSQQEASPYLSPFPCSFRKQSDDFHDLLNFSLENDPFEAPRSKLDSMDEPSNGVALLPAPVDPPEEMSPLEDNPDLEQSPQRF